jgi:hypothetical protein
MKTKTLTLFVGITLFAWLGVRAQAPEWKTEEQFIVFYVPGAVNGTLPQSIDPRGEITGSYLVGGTYHGFLRAVDGSITTFDAPGAATTGGTLGTYAISINPHGEVLGQYSDVNYAFHGFLRAVDGTITEFEAPGAVTGFGQGTFTNSINSRGEATGFYTGASSGLTRGFLRHKDGEYTTFEAPDAIGGTFPDSINPRGEITGRLYNDEYHGFVREPDGNITTFDAPGSAPCGGVGAGSGGTYPTSINPKGEITGYYNDAKCLYHGFLRKPDHHEGSKGELNDPGDATPN